jgi:hypothetical protein
MMKTGRLLIHCAAMAALSIAIMASCSKELEPAGLESPAFGAAELRNWWDIPSGPGETVLGQALTNPYALANINHAYELLMGQPGNLQPTHYYLKLLPSTGEHIAAIEEYAEETGYEFEAQPIHYEVLYQGDEDYVDPAVGEDGFSPEYGAVSAADFSAGNLPAVPFEVLDAMHIPVYESRLAFAAFVLSGNERYYEAIDGLCHPDCPAWPLCLDEPELACVVAPGDHAGLGTIDPSFEGLRPNFPDYIKDGKLGYHGEIEDISGRFPEPVVIECPPGCIAMLREQAEQPALLEWYCDCDGDGGGPPPPPPSGLTTRCGCPVFSDARKPGGRIALLDTQLGEEGLRRVKVKTTKHHWGFIWRNTDTDDGGCWRIDERYNVKRMKAKAVFRDRVSSRMIIRSFRGARFWNAALKPVKHPWRMTRTNREWHSLCLRLEDSPDNTSRAEQSFVAATVNNAVHEYYDDHSSLPSPGQIAILIHTLDDDLNAAPMFRLMGTSLFSLSDISNWFEAYNFPYTWPFWTYWELSKPDVFISFGDDRRSDGKKRVVYHEMAHVSQFAATGAEWWMEYVLYIMSIPATGQPLPYGDGSLPGAGRAELAEGMAESIELVMGDMQYGLSHSNGGDPQFQRNMNRAELRRFWLNQNGFIPEGLFFDLFDENGVFPAVVTAAEPFGIIDRVSNLPFEVQLGAFGPQVVDIPGFRDALFQQSGAASGNNQADFNLLFQSYGF